MAIEEHTVDIRYGSSFSKTEPQLCFFFSGMPTPYLSRSQEMVYYGGKWCQRTTLTLDGQIIGSEPVSGEALNTISLLNDRNKILSGFRESFNKLGVFENNTLRTQFEGCIVRDINFSPANHGIQDYSIELECFEKDEDSTDIFLGTFGVLDPSDSVNFTDNEDNTISISHSVSAVGFTTNTTSDGAEIAIVNAKNFVEGRTGYDVSKVIPQFMNGISDANLVITDIDKEINRVEGSYSCTINYLVQTGDIGDISLNAGHINIIDSSLSSGVDSDYLDVTVNYTVQGDKFASASSIRSNQPSTGTLFKIATGVAGTENLNVVPLTLEVDDTSETNKTIVVNASFDGNTIFQSLGTGVFFDYNVDVSTDDVTDTASVNIQGEIKARGNNRAQFNLKSGYYHEEVSGKLFDFANEIYTGVNYNELYSNTGWALNPLANNMSVDFDEIAGTVKCSANFDNKDVRSNYKKFVYKIDVSPALNQYSAKASCNENGLYGIFDLKTNTREKVNMSIESKADLTAYNSSFDFLEDMHNYSTLLRDSLIGTANDLVLESENSTSPKLVSNQQTFDSTITQAYTFKNDTSFYQ